MILVRFELPGQAAHQEQGAVAVVAKGGGGGGICHQFRPARVTHIGFELVLV